MVRARWTGPLRPYPCQRGPGELFIRDMSPFFEAVSRDDKHGLVVMVWDSGRRLAVEPRNWPDRRQTPGQTSRRRRSAAAPGPNPTKSSPSSYHQTPVLKIAGLITEGW